MHGRSQHYIGKNWIMVEIHRQQMGNCDITWAANIQSIENQFNKRAMVAIHRQQIGDDSHAQAITALQW